MKLIISNHKEGILKNDLELYLNKLSTINTINTKLIICPSSKQLSYFNGDNYILGSQGIEFDINFLKENSVKYTIVGHSDNRIKYHETNLEINKKIKLLLSNNIIPILCIGEEYQEQKEIEKVLGKEIEEGLKDIKDNIIIAYEPIWAINSGSIPGKEKLLKTINYIKEKVKKTTGIVPIVLYGGSVNEKTINTLNDIPQIDGYLIGSASLEIDKLKKIIEVVEC